MKKKLELGKCYKSKRSYFSNIFKVVAIDADGRACDVSGCNVDGLYAKSMYVDCAGRYEEVSEEEFNKVVEDFLDEFKRGHWIVTLEKFKKKRKEEKETT